MSRWLTILIAVTPIAPAAAQQAEPASEDRRPVALDAGQIRLEVVTDQTELSYEDRDAYYGILNHAREVDPEELQRAGADFVHERWRTSTEFGHFPEEDFPVFADMRWHPDEYRGQPVLLRGHVIKTVKLSAEEDFGIDELYESWLVTGDSLSHPLVVVYTSNPDQLPVGEDLVDGVTVAGYFLKLKTYSTLEGKVRFTPLILAHQISVRAPEPMAFPVPTGVIAGVLLAVIGGVLMLLMRTRQADRRFREQHGEKMTDALPPAFDNLPDPEVSSDQA